MAELITHYVARVIQSLWVTYNLFLSTASTWAERGIKCNFPSIFWPKLSVQAHKLVTS